MAINDFEPVKEQFNQALLSQKHDIITSIIWGFPITVNFAATGLEALSKDLYGNIIQNLLDPVVLAKHIFMIVFPEEGKTDCIISWLKENDPLFSDYGHQLQELDVQRRKNFINNTLPIISENIAINPEAWDRWEQYKKDELGTLLWGLSDISELSGGFYNRLETPLYDLFEL